MGASPAAPGQMTLRHLVEKAQLSKHGLLSEVVGEDAVVADVVHDSRQVVAGALFCCIGGENEDGHDFAEQAVRAGATALVVDHVLPIDAPQVVVRDTRMSMGLLAAALRNFPSTRMHVVGVTGTNGKTTTAHVLAEILRAHGWNTEVIGTLTSARTTPESTDLQRLLNEYENTGVQAVVMEVTSHALELHRVAGTTFEVSVFTNLSQDHLDFHFTMEKYFAAKAKLFTDVYSTCGVVNRDDVHGQLLLDTMTIDSMSYGLSDVTQVRMDARHIEYECDGVHMHAQLGGQFNVMNSLAAVSAARALGISANRYAYTPHGGNLPQTLVNTSALEIQRGDADLIILTGGEATRSRRRARNAEQNLAWMSASAQSEGDDAPEIDGEELVMNHEIELGLKIMLPIEIYPMFETAIRFSKQRTISEHQQEISELWSRFSSVAKSNPHAWLRNEYSAEEIRTPSASNRMIGFPYTKLMNSNNDVDMAAPSSCVRQKRPKRLAFPEKSGCFRMQVPTATSTTSFHIVTRLPIHRLFGLAGNVYCNWPTPPSTTSRLSICIHVSHLLCNLAHTLWVFRCSVNLRSLAACRLQAAHLTTTSCMQLRRPWKRFEANPKRKVLFGPTADTPPSIRSACTAQLPRLMASNTIRRKIKWMRFQNAKSRPLQMQRGRQRSRHTA